MTDPHTLWTEQFAARFERYRAEEERFRAEAFCDEPREVVGEPLRVMTARDLHMLDGVGNAFVCGGEYGLDEWAGHIGVFLWRLHAKRRPGAMLRDAWLYGRLIVRLRRRRVTIIGAIDAIREHVDMVFFDAPISGGARNEARPFGGSFLVPMLGQIAGEFGPFDPVSGRPWGDVPLPQVFHWGKLASRRALGKDYVERNRSDRLLSDYAAELNRLNGVN